MISRLLVFFPEWLSAKGGSKNIRASREEIHDERANTISRLLAPRTSHAQSLSTGMLLIAGLLDMRRMFVAGCIFLRGLVAFQPPERQQTSV